LILIEDFVKAITQRIKDTCQTEIEFFAKFINKELMERYDAILNNNFERITYTDAIEILRKNLDKFENEPVWGEDLFKEHERFLTDTHFKKPVFITDYPASFKSFYMRQNDDGKTVACTDLLVPKVGEIVGGSQREERFDVLMSKINEKNMDYETYKWYLELRKWGSAPHSGFGLGFERMLMYLTGIENIRDSIPFPRTKGQIYG
jgi:asparaginyl-tRNA synthetase